MGDTADSGILFRFGLFEADPAQSTLTRNGIRVKIQEQPFRLLLLLLKRPGEVVTREELRQRLWPDGTYVDFDGSLNVILKRLRAAIDDDPDNPRFIETIPRRGYRFIAPVSVINRAVEPHPATEAVARRPAESTAQVVPSVAAVAGPPASLPSNGGSHARHLIYTTIVLAVLILAGALLWRSRPSPLQASSLFPNNVHMSMRKSVAVLGFQDLSARTQTSWLATALSEMLSTELAAGEKLRLVSGEDVANLKLSSPWSRTDTLDQRTTAHIGAALNSDVLVLGSYMMIGPANHGQLRLDVRMQDAKSGEILIEIAEMGSTEDLFRLVSRIGAQLRNRLGIEQIQGTDEAGVLAALPLDPEAARFYSLGVTKLRQFDALAAKDLLEQAAKIDPKFSLVHAMLARAWAQLGYEQKRREQAKLALDLAADLPRAQHMLVEGEYYESLGDQERAESVYRALFELFPDNVEYGLRLAGVQVLLGHASQAMQIVHRLRSLPSPSSDDPRIDLAEERAMKDNKPAALALARNAMHMASARGQTLLYAQARREECMQLAYGDQAAAAGPSCEDAYNTFLAAGNRLAAADAIRLMADEMGTQGRYGQALTTYQRALTLLAGLGEHEKTGAVLNNMAIIFANQGRLEEATKLYSEAKVHFQQAGDKPNTATAMSNVADILYSKGNLPAAAKLYQETLDFIATIDHGNPGYALYRLADLRLAQGDVKAAQHLAEAAVEAMRPTQGGYQYLSGAMIELGEVLEARGELSGAHSQFEQTLAMRQKLGAEQLAAESQVELANLAIEDGHGDEAEPLLRMALAEFEKEKTDPDSSSAWTSLSRALLMQGKLEEARKAAQFGAKLSLTSSDPLLRLPAEIEQARVEMASAGTAQLLAAQKRLNSVITKARRLGYYNIESQARLALGERELRSNTSLGRRDLLALAAEARDHGLELLARQAESALPHANVVAQTSATR